MQFLVIQNLERPPKINKMQKRQHLKLIKLGEKAPAYPISQGIGASYLLLKGAVLKIDNALAINHSDIIHRRRIDLNEAIKAYKRERTHQIIKTKYEKKLISLADDLLITAYSLLQISSSSLLSSLKDQ